MTTIARKALKEFKITKRVCCKKFIMDKIFGNMQIAKKRKEFFGI